MNAATWETWSAGKSRCPTCEFLDEADFETVCDCSRWAVEHGLGQPGIRVVGHGEVTPIGPTPAPSELERFKEEA